MISHDGYNNVDQVYDGYMEQEEEWEREGLLDPAWEKQQKKVGICTVTHTNRRSLDNYNNIFINSTLNYVHTLLSEFSSALSTIESVKL